MKPPHYRDGTAAKHCSNCGAFAWVTSDRKNDPFGFFKCKMFNVRVSVSRVCDKWYAK